MQSDFREFRGSEFNNSRLRFRLEFSTIVAKRQDEKLFRSEMSWGVLAIILFDMLGFHRPRLT